MPFLKPMFCHVSSFNLIMQNVFKFAKANQIAEELDRSQCFFVDIPHTETRSAGDEFGVCDHLCYVFSVRVLVCFFKYYKLKKLPVEERHRLILSVIDGYCCEKVTHWPPFFM